MSNILCKMPNALVMLNSSMSTAMPWSSLSRRYAADKVEHVAVAVNDHVNVSKPKESGENDRRDWPFRRDRSGPLRRASPRSEWPDSRPYAEPRVARGAGEEKDAARSPLRNR